MIFIWPGLPDDLRRRGVTARFLVLWIFAAAHRRGGLGW
jgi:hypothetical protein